MLTNIWYDQELEPATEAARMYERQLEEDEFQRKERRHAVPRGGNQRCYSVLARRTKRCDACVKFSARVAAHSAQVTRRRIGGQETRHGSLGRGVNEMHRKATPSLFCCPKGMIMARTRHGMGGMGGCSLRLPWRTWRTVGSLPPGPLS